MIFNKISSLKYKQEFKILTYLVILSFIASLVGCTASETLRVESENITQNMNYKIAEVKMKDGTVINLRDKSPRYYKDWEDKKNVILYANNTVRILEKRDTVSDETKIIELDKVRWVTLESDEKEVGVTITTKNFNIYKGSLLSVTDEKISLYNKKARNNVIVIEKDSVEQILIRGDNNIFIGLGFGAFLGFITGIGIGSGISKGTMFKGLYALGGGAVGTLVGGLIGVIVGIINSTPDKTIAIFSDDDYHKLMRYIKYSSHDSQIYEEHK